MWNKAAHEREIQMAFARQRYKNILYKRKQQAELEVNSFVDLNLQALSEKHEKQIFQQQRKVELIEEESHGENIFVCELLDKVHSWRCDEIIELAFGTYIYKYDQEISQTNYYTYYSNETLTSDTFLSIYDGFEDVNFRLSLSGEIIFANRSFADEREFMSGLKENIFPYGYMKVFFLTRENVLIYIENELLYLSHQVVVDYVRFEPTYYNRYLKKYVSYQASKCTFFNVVYPYFIVGYYNGTMEIYLLQNGELIQERQPEASINCGRQIVEVLHLYNHNNDICLFALTVHSNYFKIYVFYDNSLQFVELVQVFSEYSANYIEQLYPCFSKASEYILVQSSRNAVFEVKLSSEYRYFSNCLDCSSDSSDTFSKVEHARQRLSDKLCKIKFDEYNNIMLQLYIKRSTELGLPFKKIELLTNNLEFLDSILQKQELTDEKLIQLALDNEDEHFSKEEGIEEGGELLKSEYEQNKETLMSEEYEKVNLRAQSINRLQNNRETLRQSNIKEVKMARVEKAPELKAEIYGYSPLKIEEDNYEEREANNNFADGNEETIVVAGTKSEDSFVIAGKIVSNTSKDIKQQNYHLTQTEGEATKAQLDNRMARLPGNKHIEELPVSLEEQKVRKKNAIIKEKDEQIAISGEKTIDEALDEVTLGEDKLPQPALNFNKQVKFEENEKAIIRAIEENEAGNADDVILAQGNELIDIIDQVLYDEESKKEYQNESNVLTSRGFVKGKNEIFSLPDKKKNHFVGENEPCENKSRDIIFAEEASNTEEQIPDFVLNELEDTDSRVDSNEGVEECPSPPEGILSNNVSDTEITVPEHVKECIIENNPEIEELKKSNSKLNNKQVLPSEKRQQIRSIKKINNVEIQLDISSIHEKSSLVELSDNLTEELLSNLGNSLSDEEVHEEVMEPLAEDEEELAQEEVGSLMKNPVLPCYSSKNRVLNDKEFEDDSKMASNEIKALQDLEHEWATNQLADEMQTEIGKILGGEYMLLATPEVIPANDQVFDYGYTFLRLLEPAFENVFSNSNFLIFNPQYFPNDEFTNEYALLDIYNANFLMPSNIYYFRKVFTQFYEQSIPEFVLKMLELYQEKGVKVSKKDLHIYPISFIWGYLLEYNAKNVEDFYKTNELHFQNSYVEIPCQSIFENLETEESCYLLKTVEKILLFTESLEEVVEKFAKSRSVYIIEQEKVELEEASEEDPLIDSLFSEMVKHERYHSIVENSLLFSEELERLETEMFGEEEYIYNDEYSILIDTEREERFEREENDNAVKIHSYELFEEIRQKKILSYELIISIIMSTNYLIHPINVLFYLLKNRLDAATFFKLAEITPGYFTITYEEIMMTVYNAVMQELLIKECKNYFSNPLLLDCISLEQEYYIEQALLQQNILFPLEIDNSFYEELEQEYELARNQDSSAFTKEALNTINTVAENNLEKAIDIQELLLRTINNKNTNLQEKQNEESSTSCSELFDCENNTMLKEEENKLIMIKIGRKIEHIDYLLKHIIGTEEEEYEKEVRKAYGESLDVQDDEIINTLLSKSELLAIEISDTEFLYEKLSKYEKQLKKEFTQSKAKECLFSENPEHMERKKGDNEQDIPKETQRAESQYQNSDY